MLRSFGSLGSGKTCDRLLTHQRRTGGTHPEDHPLRPQKRLRDDRANAGGQRERRFLAAYPTPNAASVAEGADAVCAFASGDANANADVCVGVSVVETLAGFGGRLVALPGQSVSVSR